MGSMTGIFKTVLNMSVTGSVIILAIILIRFFMKKLPKKYSYILWMIPAVRLICPVSFSSAFSLFNVVKPEVNNSRMDYFTGMYTAVSETVPSPAVSVNINENVPVTPVIHETAEAAAPVTGAAGGISAIDVISFIWLAGMAAFIIYSVISYVNVYRRVRYAVKADGYYVCDDIGTPFVFGIIKPKIYVPAGISDEDRSCVLAHENVHIKRKDHIINLLCVPVLAVHWFNPLVWIGYKLMIMDMELSCDERALENSDAEQRKIYANALLNMSMKQNKFTFGNVLNFGESNISSRIKSVLTVKKTGVLITAVLIAVTAVIAVTLLTNASKAEQETTAPDSVSEADEVYDVSRFATSRQALEHYFDNIRARDDVEGVYPEYIGGIWHSLRYRPWNSISSDDVMVIPAVYTIRYTKESGKADEKISECYGLRNDYADPDTGEDGFWIFDRFPYEPHEFTGTVTGPVNDYGFAGFIVEPDPGTPEHDISDKIIVRFSPVPETGSRVTVQYNGAIDYPFNENTEYPEADYISVYRGGYESVQEPESGDIKRIVHGNKKVYYEMNDGTWYCDGHRYKTRQVITGRLSDAAGDSTFVYLSNAGEITFEQAWKACGLSSNIYDYFDIEEAVLVELN